MQKYAAPAAVGVALVLVAVLAFWPAGEQGGGGEGEAAGHESASRGGEGSGAGQVDMTMHVMSQCPYGVKVVQAITPVARKLGNRFKLNLQYIGRIEGDELTSMHGESEVAGNKLQLCVHEHGNTEQWLDFLDCQNENWRRIPTGWEQCAEQARVDVAAVRTCYEGAEGTRLLRASYEASDTAGARGSPTIFVGGERYSGGRAEADFARAICAQYEGGQPAYCSDIPAPPQVPVTVLADRRCDRPECDTDRQLAGLKARIPGAKVTNVDYSSDRGRELFEQAGVKMLPAILIGREIQQDREAFKMIAQSSKRQGDMFVQTVGRFDPVAGAWVERPEVPIQFLVDARCKTRECEGAMRFEAFIKRQVPQAKITTIDWADEGAPALWKRVAAAMEDVPEAERRPAGLPLALFGAAIEQEEEAFSRLERRFVKVGDEFMFQLGRWDPTAEICDNEADDDGNRLADCADPSCAEQMVCRPEKARQLSAFVMSQCPYGVQVLNAMEEVLSNFGRDRSKIDFRIEFVGQVREGGELSTMHGEAELAENLREACAQRHYPNNYAFMDYVLCRNKNIRSNEWRSCVQEGMDAEVIERCAEGEEGRDLMTKSFNLANSLGFTGSPSWLLNNRHTINGRDPESIKTEFCERNEQPECANTLTKAAPGRPGGGGGGGGGNCG
jgi:glutaredoxin